MGWLKAVSNWLTGVEEGVEEASVPLSERGRVLVIDDNVEFLNTLTETLRTEGFSVLRSNSGAKGLNMLRYAGGEVRVILLDFDMPHLDGAGTLRFIQQFAPQAKVIAITGFDERLLPPSFREGVVAVFHKPFDIAKLIEQLRTLLMPATTKKGMDHETA
ncbi:MAG: response regulator [Verrucomicrobiae bacterium]|nr:response regulator [Verrucomicrobiae bacterium]MCX7915989.1 response regulator [Verrucomicrobiae bacterium]MDW8343504.1 response regulator [Verrucomicrobiae bacterium]